MLAITTPMLFCLFCFTDSEVYSSKHVLRQKLYNSVARLSLKFSLRLWKGFCLFACFKESLYLADSEELFGSNEHISRDTPILVAMCVLILCQAVFHLLVVFKLLTINLLVQCLFQTCQVNICEYLCMNVPRFGG